MKTLTPNEIGPSVESVIQNTPSETEILIVQDGKPIARLEPEASRRERIKELVEQIREHRKGNRLDGLSIRERINEGRR